MFLQNAMDKDHSVRAMIGNGLRPDIWLEFESRFGIQRILEFYAATEGNVFFLNYFNTKKSCGYFSPLMVSIISKCIFH